MLKYRSLAGMKKMFCYVHVIATSELIIMRIDWIMSGRLRITTYVFFFTEMDIDKSVHMEPSSLLWTAILILMDTDMETRP